MSDKIEVVCGWCDGSIGSSGQCERDCEGRRALDSMTPEEVAEVALLDSESGVLQ